MQVLVTFLNKQDPVSIRRASLGDIEPVISFIEPFVAEGKILRRNLDELQSLIEQYVIAEIGDEIVGCVVLEIYSPKLAEIRSLAVSAAYQGRGIGKLLVNACIEQATN